jgi:hypothetical protein
MPKQTGPKKFGGVLKLARTSVTDFPAWLKRGDMEMVDWLLIEQGQQNFYFVKAQLSRVAKVLNISRKDLLQILVMLSNPDSAL